MAEKLGPSTALFDAFKAGKGSMLGSIPIPNISAGPAVSGNSGSAYYGTVTQGGGLNMWGWLGVTAAAIAVVFAVLKK